MTIKTLGDLCHHLFGDEGPTAITYHGWTWVRWQRGLGKGPVYLVEVREQEKRSISKDIIVDLRAQVEAIVGARMGDHMRGYALVVWDEEGDARTVFNIHNSPIGRGMLGVYCADAINRHVAVDMTKEQLETGQGHA